MKFQSRRAIRCAMGTMILCLLGTTWARSQSAKAGTDQKPQMSEEAFKNIQVLRGIPVNEFMGTMGFFSASLSMNCTDCHVDGKRRQLGPVCRRHSAEADCAQDGFDGEPHQSGRLRRNAAGDLLHLPSRLPEARGHAESGRAIRALRLRTIRIEWRFFRGLPTSPAAAEQILDKYIQAVGGAQQLAKLTSFYREGNLRRVRHGFSKGPDRNFCQSSESANHDQSFAGRRRHDHL